MDKPDKPTASKKRPLKPLKKELLARAVGAGVVIKKTGDIATGMTNR